MHGTVLVFFVLTGRTERNICQLSYSLADWCKGYGFSISEYAFLLVLLSGQCCNDFFFICSNRSCKRWMDSLSSIKCAWAMHRRVRKRVWIYWIISYGIICCFIIAGWFKLYFYHSEYAYKGNEHDQIATYNLGTFLYCGTGCTFFPCTYFRLYLIIIRPACRNKFLSL